MLKTRYEIIQAENGYDLLINGMRYAFLLRQTAVTVGEGWDDPNNAKLHSELIGAHDVEAELIK